MVAQSMRALQRLAREPIAAIALPALETLCALQRAEYSFVLIFGFYCTCLYNKYGYIL